MPALLNSLKIRGIRSYSPQNDRAQTIDFMPLTLIVGSNGTGKTTIIEALKFIISGQEPPLSDCRRNFVSSIEPKNNGYSGNALVELRFQNNKDESCIAKREISKSISKATPSVSSSFKVGKQSWTSVHKQDDWSRTIPRLFNLPNPAILNNVVLCHQEENLWCMGDSSTVKSIFDRVFGCEQYKREITNINAEVKTCKNEIMIHERDLLHLKDQVALKNTLSKDVIKIESEIEALKVQCKDLDGKIENISASKTNLKQALSEMERDLLQQKSDLAEQSEHLSIDHDRLVREIARMDTNSNSINYKITSKESLIKKLTDQLTLADPSTKCFVTLSENFNKMAPIVENLPRSEPVELLQNLIDESKQIVNKLGKAQIDRVARSKEDIEKERKDIETSKLQVNAITNEKLKLDDELRKIQVEIEKVRRAAKEAHNRAINERKFNKIHEDLKLVEDEERKFRDKRSNLVGSKNQLERQLMRSRSDLNGFSRVNCKFSESLGRIVCNKIMLEDLEKLKDCFQDSITTFHNQMIAKINDSLRYRWRQIYQGNDIDKIELVDEEITKGKDKKAYNYYLAMRKNGQLMKMREKSSAGQRALASIILRMTLAELFVKDFAFIALDEPTANLDLANVKSLAKAIGAYVRCRSEKGVNIQWIIITHDEQFLAALDAECSPYFYRTVIDDDGFSTIRKIAYQDASQFFEAQQNFD